MKKRTRRIIPVTDRICQITGLPRRGREAFIIILYVIARTYVRTTQCPNVRG